MIETSLQCHREELRNKNEEILEKIKEIEKYKIREEELIIEIKNMQNDFRVKEEILKNEMSKKIADQKVDLILELKELKIS